MFTKVIASFGIVLALAGCQQAQTQSEVRGDVVGNAPRAPATEGEPFVGEYQGKQFLVLITPNHRQALLEIGRAIGRNRLILNLVAPLRCAGCLGTFGEETTLEASRTLITLTENGSERHAVVEKIAPELLSEDVASPDQPEGSDSVTEARCSETPRGPGYTVTILRDADGQLSAQVQNRLGAALPVYTFAPLVRGHLGVVSSILYQKDDELSLAIFPAGLTAGQPAPAKLDVTINGEAISRNLSCALN
jgi:hypothetical protein